MSVAALTGGLFFLSDDLVTLQANGQMLALAGKLTPPVLMVRASVRQNFSAHGSAALGFWGEGLRFGVWSGV